MVKDLQWDSPETIRAKARPRLRRRLTPEQLGRLLRAAFNFVQLALLMATTVYGSWVLTVLWGWYAVPLGYVPLALRTALGVMFCAAVPLTGLSVQIIIFRTRAEEIQGAAKNPMEELRVAATTAIMFTVLLALGAFWNWVL